MLKTTYQKYSASWVLMSREEDGANEVVTHRMLKGSETYMRVTVYVGGQITSVSMTVTKEY